MTGQDLYRIFRDECMNAGIKDSTVKRWEELNLRVQQVWHRVAEAAELSMVNDL